MLSLEKLKKLINEQEYPYFTDEDLIERLDLIDDDIKFNSLVRELCIIKSSIEEIKLGDITIPSPKEYFLILANKYRNSGTGVVVRADAR